MSLRILNRDFTHPSDGWYNIEAKGNHPNRRAGIVQVIDDDACAAIVAAFNREAGAAGYAGMLIDHEHFKHDDDKETLAYGWLMQLQNRADGIYGKIRWSGTGQKAVDDGDYRFFSTEYDPADLVVLNKGKSPKEVRPMKLAGLTLTNVNNNKGQKPITNRSNTMITVPGVSEDRLATIINRLFGADAPVDMILNGDYVGHPFHGNQYVDGGPNTHASKASRLAHQASNDADTAAEHHHAAMLHRAAAKEQAAKGHTVTAQYHLQMAAMHDSTAKGISSETAKNRGIPSESKTNMSTRNKLGLAADASEEAVETALLTVLNRNKELETAVIEADLAKFEDRIDPTQKEFVKSMLVTNRAGALAFLEKQPKLPTSPGRVTNRGAMQENKANVLNLPDAAAKSAEIAEEVSKLRGENKRLTYESAYNMVRNRRPELFGLPARGEKAA